MTKIFKNIVWAALIIVPAGTYAAFEYLEGALVDILRIINLLISLTIAVAIVVFFIGLVKVLAKAGSPQAIEQGRRQIIWGLIIIFIMVSLWGIIALMRGVFLSPNTTTSGGNVQEGGGSPGPTSPNPVGPARPSPI